MSESKSPDTKSSDTKSPDAKDADTKHDYRSTLFLPSTDFPMKAGLPDAEPRWLKRWEEMGLYKKLKGKSVRVSARVVATNHGGKIAKRAVATIKR